MPSPAYSAADVGLNAGATAPRTRFRKDHVPARRLDDAGTFALRASPLHRRQSPEPATRAAVLLARDGDLARTAAHRFVERQRQRLMYVRTTFGRLPVRLVPPMEEFAKQIAKG